MTVQRPRPFHAALVLLTLLGFLAAFAARAAWLGDQDLWWDEGLAIWAVRQPILQTTLWTASDVHPPLYFWLLWGWVRFAGDTPFAMRFLTAIFGMLVVALSYAVARRLGGKWAGMLAVWITGLSRFMVWWSQEMRMYMLAALLSLLALYAALRFLDAMRRTMARPSPWPALGLYVLAATGAMYTIYLSAANILLLSLLVGLMGLAHAWGRRWRQALMTLGGWFVANVIVIGLVIPWLALALGNMRSWSVASPSSLTFPFELYGVLLASGISTDLGAAAWTVVLVGGVFGAGIIAALAMRRRTQPAWPVVALLALALALPPVILFVLTQPGRTLFYVPRLEARYFVPFAAYAFAGLAWAIGSLWRLRRWAGVAGLAVVLGVFAWSLPQHYAGRHLSAGYPSIARTIRAHAQPGDGVALISGGRYPLFLYEYDREGLSGLRAPVIQIPRHHPLLTSDNLEDELQPLLTDFNRLWVVLADPQMEDPEGLALPWLQQHRATGFDQRFNDKRLVLLADSPVNLGIPLPEVSPQIRLENGGRVLGYDLPVRRGVPGESVYQAVYVQSPNSQPLSVVWQHESGREIMSRTLTVAADTNGATRLIVELPVYAATPAGQYSLVLRWPDGEATVLPGPLVDGTRAMPGPRPRIDHRAFVGPFDLLGFAAEPAELAVSPGQTLTLYLDWHIGQQTDQRYTFFAHLLGSEFNPATNGPVWAGHDSEPLDGGLPTTQWWTNDVIRDEVKLAVPAGAPPGDYQIEIGAYPTGNPERLEVEGENADPDNRRVLLRMAVRVH